MLSARQAVRKWREVYGEASANALELYGPTRGTAGRNENDAYLEKFRDPFYQEGLNLRQHDKAYARSGPGRKKRRPQNEKLFHQIERHTRKWRGPFAYRYSREDFETDVERHTLAALALAMQL